MAETNGRSEYCIWDSELKQTDVMDTCYVGAPRHVPFPGYTFCLKILMHGNILPGNRPNFFVEHVTKSQNQPYRFKSGKNTFPWAKLLIT